MATSAPGGISPYAKEGTKMMPIGPLMIEHRLIERMITVMKEELQRLQKGKEVDTAFIVTAVDFIRMYADRCHHGKEEDILFRELEKKNLSEEHKRVMKELLEEHKWGRKTTGRLVEANVNYNAGDKKALPVISECLRSLVGFYPKHIEKEDKDFFIPVMDYFSQDEKDAMLKEGHDFDQKLIHEKYEKTVAEAAKRFSSHP
jgi:hemerythrin-like domain-containing protein